MKTILIIALFGIIAGLTIYSCKPVHVPLQQDYMHQMLGKRAWAGTENDSILPDTTTKAPGHDTAYTVILYTNISFVNNNTIYIALDSGCSYNNFHEVSFNYYGMNTGAQTMLFYATDVNVLDTLVYNYAANSMILMQHYSNTTGTYSMNMHSP